MSEDYTQLEVEHLTCEAEAAAIAQREGYPIADEDCACEFDHLCDQHYKIAHGKPREAA
jgi:hypothetical protein